MFFDAQLQAAEMEFVDHGDFIEQVVDLAIAFPAGPGTVIPFHIGRIRLPMSYEVATAKAKELIALIEGKETPEKTDIVIAQSLAGVEQAVKATEKLKRGK